MKSLFLNAVGCSDVEPAALIGVVEADSTIASNRDLDKYKTTEKGKRNGTI